MVVVTSKLPVESPNPHAEEATVLILAYSGREAGLSCDMLRQASVPCAACDSAADLIERVRDGAGVTVVMAEALDDAHARKLQDVLAKQPKWSDLPLILVAAHDTPPMRLREIATRRNTTLLHRPLKVTTFVTTVRTALESRLRQYEVRDLLKRLEGRSRQIQQLALKLTQTEERERQRLGQILHDDLQQVLVAGKLHVNLLPMRVRDNQLDEAVAQLSELLEEAIQKSRNLSHELVPPMLHQHGLVASLNCLAEWQQQRHGLKVTVDADPEAEPSDDQIRIFLYRCAQELLFNVVKHSGVNEAYVSVSAGQDHVIMCVQDQGRGYDAEQVSGDEGAGGMGLLSIRERANLLGGRLDVEAAEGVGSKFTLTMPHRQEAPLVDERLATVDAGSAEPVGADTSWEDKTNRGYSRIILADDHSVIRSGLRLLLEQDDQIEIVAEANDGAEAVELAERLRPDLVLMDVGMPGLDGIEATRRIKAHHPAIRIIGLSMHDDEQTASRIRDAGAEDCLSKAGPADRLLSAARRDSMSPVS